MAPRAHAFGPAGHCLNAGLPFTTVPENYAAVPELPVALPQNVLMCKAFFGTCLLAGSVRSEALPFLDFAVDVYLLRIQIHRGLRFGAEGIGPEGNHPSPLCLNTVPRAQG